METISDNDPSSMHHNDNVILSKNMRIITIIIAVIAIILVLISIIIFFSMWKNYNRLSGKNICLDF